MKKKSTIRKVNPCLKLLFVLIAFVGSSKTIQAQDSLAYSPADSLLFAQRVAQWKAMEVAPDSLLDWQTAVVVQVVYEKMEKIVKAFEPEIDSMRQSVAMNDSLLMVAKLDSTITADSLKTRSNSLKEEKASLKRLVSDQKKRSKNLQWASKVALQPPSYQRKKLPELYQRWTALLPPIPEPELTERTISESQVAAAPVAPEQLEAPLPPIEESLTPTKKKKEKEKVVRYDPKKDVLFNPAERPCTLAIQRTDPFTGSTYRETQKEELFRNTNAVLRKMLADTQAHIICQAALSNEPVTGGGSLHLVFTIKDANARRTFGGLPAKSYLSLKFIDGEIVTLFNDINQEIQMDMATSTAIFQARYGFQPALFKVLMKKELDSIRVAWSTGYEDYSVYNVGLLQEMAKCLFR